MTRRIRRHVWNEVRWALFCPVFGLLAVFDALWEIGKAAITAYQRARKGEIGG